MRALAVLIGLFMAGTAVADLSLVKLSTAGNGTYDITGVREFDWQSSGDLVVVDALPVPAVANGQVVNTFAAWAAAAVPGDTVTFNIHLHARLNAMIDPNGGDVSPPTLSKDGATCQAGAGCFEITAAGSGEESATLVAPGVLAFNSIVANYKFFFDSTPDSNVANPGNQAPTSFANGVAMLEGTSVAVAGTFVGGVGGSNLISNTVSSYNANFIETDTPGLVTLNATTFDNLVTFAGSLQAIINVGQPAGLAPYIVLQADQRFKIDSNSEFAALPQQQPENCRVTGGGNDVDENLIVSDNLNQAFPNFATLFPGYAFDANNPNKYTYGGQVGAPSLLAPGPFGEWTHHQKFGQTDDFVFHAGSHSAPKDTRITTVVCSDPEACKPAVANAGFKQIDFEGTGSFRSLKKNGSVNGFPVVTDQGGGGTRHYFRVHIQDLGEPGGTGGKKQHACTITPGDILGTGGQKKKPCADCPDVYQIEIHATTDPASPIIYTVGAFVDGGNLQIHPPVGGN
jgi:hypothetical protein